MKPELNQLIHWATGAGAILREGFGKTHQIRYKGVIDLVTEMDKLSETYLVDQIQGNFPGHAIITEESGYLAGDDGTCWHIDPLDGTLNYSHGMPIFSVSLAYAVHGKVQLGVVYDPLRDECFAAEMGKGAFLNGQPIQVASSTRLIDSLLATGFPSNDGTDKQNALQQYVYMTGLTQGVRRLGSAALDMVYVAAGRLDGFWTNSIHSWDIAAGGLIVEEAGGKMTDVRGGNDYLIHPCSAVAANPALHALILAEINPKVNP